MHSWSIDPDYEEAPELTPEQEAADWFYERAGLWYADTLDDGYEAALDTAALSSTEVAPHA